MAVSNRVRFGQIVRARREELGLTQDDVAAAGGPADTTQTRVENADGDEPRLSTRNKFDKPLRWAPGSAARVWTGGDPTPLESSSPRSRHAHPESTPRRQSAPLVLGPTEVPISLEQLTKLLDINSTLHAALDVSPDNALLIQGVADIKKFVSALTGTWVTEILERNAGEGNDIPLIIQFAFSKHLEVPVDPADPEAEEKLYRRWLIGKTEAVSGEMETGFRRRLKEKLTALG